mmetsp:Transcript_10383/g.12510  ORF Transcript_10383/g.12510 Transcript_10383/m.12510 type:complete len:85 (-) Transcript_10383:6-260(-)
MWSLSSKATTSRLWFSSTFKMFVGKLSSQIDEAVFVFQSFRRRGEKAGVSPAPTKQIRLVQKSIRTVPIPPSVEKMFLPKGSQL